MIIDWIFNEKSPKLIKLSDTTAVLPWILIPYFAAMCYFFLSKNVSSILQKSWETNYNIWENKNKTLGRT